MGDVKHNARWMLIRLAAALVIPAVLLGCVALYWYGLLAQTMWGHPPVWMFVVGLLLGGIGLLGPMIGAAAHREFSRRRALLMIEHVRLAIAASAPLPPSLRIAAATESMSTRRAMRTVAASLESGQSLSTALSGRTARLDARSHRMIAAAERIGQTGGMLDYLTMEMRREDDTASRRDFLWIYPLTMIAGMLVVTILVLLMTLPRFESIAEDYGIVLPRLTSILIEMMDGWMLAALMIAVLYLPLVWIMWTILYGRRGWLPRVGATIGAGLPWVGPVVGDRQRADVLMLLAAAMRAGVDLSTALTEAMQLDIGWGLRRRLKKWLMAMERGATISDAARAAGMPRLVTGMMHSSEATGRLDEAMRFCTNYYQQRFRRSIAILEAAMVLIMEVGLGVIVAGIGLAVFLPLVSMIDTAASWWGHY
ncbi:MAG: hypothetical protein GC162_20215 [Planctomycetes bacterium]|nr:hypothetical protein [Planctomycetota bacterium]